MSTRTACTTPAHVSVQRDALCHLPFRHLHTSLSIFERERKIREMVAAPARPFHPQRIVRDLTKIRAW